MPPELARDVVEAALVRWRPRLRSASSARRDALRRTLRSAALALAEAGVLPSREVAKLGKGRGAVDVGAECAARKPALDGMSPIEVRDRLWTLLAMRHERFGKAYVFGTPSTEPRGPPMLRRSVRSSSWHQAKILFVSPRTGSEPHRRGHLL